MEQPRVREPGSLAAVFERLVAAGFGIEAIAEVLGRSLVSVLTAHPTEVQRKSQRGAERSIAQLLLERDTLSSERERKRNELLLRARIAQLWQTRLLRYSRLSVSRRDRECARILPNDLLAANSAAFAELEEQLGAIDVASFFRMASWIGGDRDGNPNVNAQTLILALPAGSGGSLRRQKPVA
jgi:phosphoenolpyruvate carboxylase